MLVENFQENGGICVDVGNGESAGPPILDVHIPSNLEIDPNAWFSNEFTFSPYWIPATADAGSSTSDMSSSVISTKSITEVSDRVTVESCWDESSNAIDMSVHYFDIEPTDAGTLPWIALGFRSSDVCAMTPPNEGTTPLIIITHRSGDSNPEVYSGELTPEAKGMSQESFVAIYQSLVPLDESTGYSSVSLNAPMVDLSAAVESSISDGDTVTLNFKQVVGEKPDTMYFTYAVGASSQLGVHTTRACFELTDFTSCSQSSNDSAAMSGGVTAGIDDLTSESSQKVSTRSEEEKSSGGQTIIISYIFPLASLFVTMAFIVF